MHVHACKKALTVQLQSWGAAFSDALPCPTPEFVTPAKLPSLFASSFALQRQRVEVTRELAGPHGGREDEAVRRLAGLARAVRVLPLWSCHVRAICMYPTSLASLLDISAELVGENPRKRKRRAEEDEEHEETPLDFWSFFPGARRLLKGGRGGTLGLHPFIRTDGVSASVTMRRSGSTGHGREKEFKTPMLDRGALLPAPGQRLCACDPGRRDMITAVTNDPNEKPIFVSTRQYRHNARSSAAAHVTR